MIIIIGEIILITIPFVIYVMYEAHIVRLKKWWLIIPECIAIIIFLFSSFKVILDIPNVVRGGMMCEGQIAYATETSSQFTITTITTTNGEKYWAIGDIRMFEKMGIDTCDLYNNSSIELYVLPNTQLIYRVEHFRCTLYSIYDFNFEVVDLCLFEFVLILMIIKFKKNA